MHKDPGHSTPSRISVYTSLNSNQYHGIGVTSTSNICQDFERKYWDNPELFWSLPLRPRDPSAFSIIRHISESLDQQDYLNPIRRRILLSVLFERVQSESQRIQATGNILRRGKTFKCAANDALLDCLWDKTDQSAKKKRERFNRNVRAGGKWTRFEPGVLIGLADQQAWTT